MFGFNQHDLRLLINLFKMLVRDRFLGSALGSVWAITNPLFMLAVFTYVFGFIFKSKLPGAETTLTYVIWLISGYGPWLSISEAILSSANSVVGATGIVKNIAFKTELLPIAGALIGIINLTVSLIFLLILIPWSGGSLTWNLLFLPAILIVQFAFLIGLGIWLSVIVVFIRDVAQLLPTLLLITLFMTPIFYPIENIPNIAQKISLLNPIHHIMSSYRDVFVESRAPDTLSLVIVFVASLTLIHLGLRMFRRAKGQFDSAL